jgi:hypothetical protein
VSAEHEQAAARDRREVLDEARATCLQALYYVSVVNDLVADVDRWAAAFEEPLYDFDRIGDAGAKAPGARYVDDTLFGKILHVMPEDRPVGESAMPRAVGQQLARVV